MVGELGSAFKNEGGGVSSWLNKTMGAKVAYYAGFTYWACHITYIASKGSGSLKALSWAIFRNAETYDSLPTLGVQLATLAVFLLGCFIASRGLNPLKKLLTLAGTTMFVMSLLYIVMMFAAARFETHVLSMVYTAKSKSQPMPLSPTNLSACIRRLRSWFGMLLIVCPLF